MYTYIVSCVDRFLEQESRDKEKFLDTVMYKS
jgi:hypothetical protein